MYNINIFNTNGGPMQLAAEEVGLCIRGVYEPDRLNASTAKMNFPAHNIKHVYLGTELASSIPEAEVFYVNVARKEYKKADSAVPIIDKNAYGCDGNGVLVMKNAFRMISLCEPEMFVIESGIKIHPIAMEAFLNIPGYYIQKIEKKDSSAYGSPMKKVRTFIVGTKRPYAPRMKEYAPRSLDEIFEKGVDYGELPVYATNRLYGRTSAYPCHIIDPMTDIYVPNISSHYAKDDSAVLVKMDGRLRPLTTTEIKRLYGYPDEYIFQGTNRQAIRQIGDSVGVGISRWLTNDVIMPYFRNEQFSVA